MDDPSGLAVVADGLGLKGPRGWAFRGVSVDAAPGALIAVAGPSGTGRTCLLLALTGRMRPTEGRAAVGGLELPRYMAAVRRGSRLAHVAGVTDLDPSLTVAEHLREQELLGRRFGGALPRPRQLLRPRAERRRERRRHIDEALATAGLDLAVLPKRERTAVRDLERVEALRLSLALALLGRPRLLGIDDTDLKLSSAERGEVWDLLRSVADTGVTVLAVCSEPPSGAVVVRTGTGRSGAEPDEPDAAVPRPAALTGSADPAGSAASDPDGSGVADPAGSPGDEPGGPGTGAAASDAGAPAADADRTDDGPDAGPHETGATGAPSNAPTGAAREAAGEPAGSAPGTRTDHDEKEAADDAIAATGRS